MAASVTLTEAIVIAKISLRKPGEKIFMVRAAFEHTTAPPFYSITPKKQP